MADSNKIVNNFAGHFERACRPLCTPFSEKRNEELELQYDDMIHKYITLPVFRDDNIFDVELVGNQIRSIKNGKAAGLDELSVEHFKHI